MGFNIVGWPRKDRAGGKSRGAGSRNWVLGFLFRRGTIGLDILTPRTEATRSTSAPVYLGSTAGRDDVDVHPSRPIHNVL